MKNNKNITSFLDGFLYIYRNNNELNPFGAKINTNNVKNMELIYKLAYSETFKRLQDYELANSSNGELTLKVKTHLVKGIFSTDKVLINNTMYSIIYLDEDKFNKTLYLYLEEDGDINE